MNSYAHPVQLTDAQMRRYVTDGFLVLQTGLPAVVHRHIRERCADVFATMGNPGNEILEHNPAVQLVFADPVVRGALGSLLGDDFFMHPHRHCHQNVPGAPAQKNHKDSYEDDLNVRHHRSRWAMAMYYPQAVTTDMGPTGVTPGSQYLSDPASVADADEIAVTGDAGTVIIVHYDLWHRALRNVSGRPRYMLKFLFCRASEPIRPAWAPRAAEWQAPADRAGDPLEPLWAAVWRWHRGAVEREPTRGGEGAPLARLLEGPERTRLQAAYSLAPYALDSLETVRPFWQQEADRAEAKARAREHTNPCEHVIGYALSAQGERGLGILDAALADEDWRIRGNAADAAGDMGRAARPLASRIAALLRDASPWVRRNAAEALGTLEDRSDAATRALGRALEDENYLVGHNAALSLRKLGRAADATVQALLATTAHPELYRRRNALLALGALCR